MRTNVLVVMMIVFLFFSCTQDNNPSGDLNGTYAGTYLQSGELKDTAQVKIDLQRQLPDKR
ncbi:MAG TPA: hypothetical protein VKI61_12915 [Chitinophagaceae bacterium]|nr:hypothetical protein [Chitinophagaceae bacterium]